MFNRNLLTVAMIAVTTSFGCAQQSTPEIKTDNDKVSYSIGYDIGRSLKAESIDNLNLDVLLRGMRDAQGEGEAALTDEEMMTVLMNFQQELMAKQQLKYEESLSRNLTEGRDFLASNALKEGVQTTSSGLQYRVITEGSGPRPSVSSRVTVHYRGTLIDGTEFDSSYSRGEPATFGLNQVIPGWTEGLQLMNVGSKYELVIPSDLAYGERGTQGTIGPNAVLVFEVELIEIQ
jgi:FKBP-type peptidyl-prolyl cis-trans isomerase